MPDSSLEKNDHLEVISFDEVEDGVQLIFGSVWMTNRGFEFAKKCWEIFTNLRLTVYDNQIEKCYILIHLIALGEIYREFNGIAFDEFIEPNYEEWAEILNISKYRIGQLIGKKFGYMEGDDFEDYISAIGYLSDEDRKIVYDTLVKGFKSKEQLFYEFYLTGQPDEEVIEKDDEFDDSYKTPSFEEVINGIDIATGVFEAYSWVSSGCYPYY